MSKPTPTAASTDTQLLSSSSTVTPSSNPATSQTEDIGVQRSARDRMQDMSHVSGVYIAGTAGGFTVHWPSNDPASVTAHASLHLQRAAKIRDQMNRVEEKELTNLEDFKTRLTAIVDHSNVAKENIGTLVSVRNPQTCDSYPNEGAFQARLDVGDNKKYTSLLWLSQLKSNPDGLGAAKRDARARRG